MAQNCKMSGNNVARNEAGAKAKRPAAVWYVATKAGRPVLTMLWFPELPSDS